MRIRQLLTRITVVAGLAAAFGGYLAAWQTDDMFVGTVWMVLGVGLMAGGAIYSMAMDDPEARDTALTTHRDSQSVDLREPVSAPATKSSETSTRVSV